MNPLPAMSAEISPMLSAEFKPIFRSGQPARKVDFELKSALKIKDTAHQCSLDWFGEILNRKLFKDLGYGSVNQYAREELGFSNSKIGDYIKLTKKLEKLPHLKNSLNSGELGYTKGRLLTDVVDESNEKQWLDFALKNPRRRVEEEVKRAKRKVKDEVARQPSLLPQSQKKLPAAIVPVRVNLEMTPTQFARYELMWEQIRKQRNVKSEKVEALLEIMASFLDDSCQNRSPRGDNSKPNPGNSKPAAQIHIHHCPECKSSTVQTIKGELEIGKNELQRYQCDCQVSQPNHRNVTSIPPAVRHAVFARDRHKCQTPGCNHTSFLEIHHIVRRAEGGSNDLSNLICKCSACHRLIHAHSYGTGVKSPTVIYSYDELG